MENYCDFRSKLEKGQLIESGVCHILSRIFPDCVVKNTQQEFGSKDRDDYKLCDCVVIRNGVTILGIECKRSKEKFRKCMEFNGWDGDYNTPLNNTSIRKYKESDFPFYVLNVNEFCHKVFAADIHTIMKSRHDNGQKKPSGTIIYNFDSSSWMTYTGDFKIQDVLTDIARKEGLC